VIGPPLMWEPFQIMLPVATLTLRSSTSSRERSYGASAVLHRKQQSWHHIKQAHGKSNWFLHHRAFDCTCVARFRHPLHSYPTFTSGGQTNTLTQPALPISPARAVDREVSGFSDCMLQGDIVDALGSNTARERTARRACTVPPTLGVKQRFLPRYT
jgi:hypothetical protein